MASLKLRLHAVEEALVVVHCVEARTRTEEVEELDFNSRTNDDNQVKPIKRTSTFRLRRKE